MRIVVYIIIVHSLFVIICIAVTAQVRAGVISSDIVSEKAGTFFAGMSVRMPVCKIMEDTCFL